MSKYYDDLADELEEQRQRAAARGDVEAGTDRREVAGIRLVGVGGVAPVGQHRPPASAQRRQTPGSGQIAATPPGVLDLPAKQRSVGRL